MARKRKINTDNIVSVLVETANEKGYTIMFNGGTEDKLYIVAYPYQNTLCTQEELARLLYDKLDEFGVTEEELMEQFQKDVTPDDLEEFAFVGKGKEINISVFHNKYILIKQIVMKI